MEPSIHDLFALIWLVGGTVFFKRLLRAVQSGAIGRGGYLLVAVPFGAVPLLVEKLGWLSFSAYGIVMAGITLFWFALLAVRVDNSVRESL